MTKYIMMSSTIIDFGIIEGAFAKGNNSIQIILENQKNTLNHLSVLFVKVTAKKKPIDFI